MELGADRWDGRGYNGLVKCCTEHREVEGCENNDDSSSASNWLVICNFEWDDAVACIYALYLIVRIIIIYICLYKLFRGYGRHDVVWQGHRSLAK